MKISVVICTQNRSASLRRALQSLCVQNLPAHEFEVLVIDNASTDDTKIVSESFATLPVRYIYETKIGLSRARNTGWQAAQSKYVAFLDDDAEATPNWLESLLETFSSHDTQRNAVGGKVELVLPIEKPSWLDESLLFCLGEIDVGLGTTILNSTPFYLPGCNIAFSKDTLLQLGGFPTRLGRKGTNLLSGEEILLQQKIKAAGGSILYTHAAHIKHHVDDTRLTRRWFMKRMYWEGVTNKKLETLHDLHTPCTVELKLLIKQIFSFGFLFKARFFDVCTAAKQIGRIIECIRPY